MDTKFYHNYFKIENEHWLMKVRRAIIFDIIKRFALRNKKILDFGCGSGYMVSKLGEAGFESYGLDMSVEAIEFGWRRGINNINIARTNRINFDSRSFDIVLALDVIEHIKTEYWLFKEIERVLVPGGIAIIMAPAFMFLWGVQDEVSHHYRRYTLRGLCDIVEKNGGFQVVKKSYFNTFLFLPIVVVRLASRWFNIKNRQSDFDINNSMINNFFFWIFNLERLCLRHMNFPFGVSTLLVARKNRAQ